MGSSPVSSISGYRYYVIFIDGCTRYRWIHPLAYKSDVFQTFCTFQNYIERYFETNSKVFCSDGGGEFQNKSFKSLFSSNGIVHQFSCLHTPEQNGVAECKHRHIVETGLSLLAHSFLPTKYWFESFHT